jgi:hypothetical protein
VGILALIDGHVAADSDIIRYRFRGTKIATPWNTEQMQGYRGVFRQITDERADLDHLQRTLVG